MCDRHSLYVKYFSQNYGLNSALLPHANTQSPGVTNVSSCYGSDLNVSMNQTSCSCAEIVYYTSSILVKIMHLSQLFFHMLTLKALM